VYAEKRRPKNPTLVRIWSAIRRLKFSPADSEPARTARMVNAVIRTERKEGVKTLSIRS
jgi:hypothetical protein